jgi:hypothetical protein
LNSSTRRPLVLALLALSMTTIATSACDIGAPAAVNPTPTQVINTNLPGAVPTLEGDSTVPGAEPTGDAPPAAVGTPGMEITPGAAITATITTTP